MRLGIEEFRRRVMGSERPGLPCAPLQFAVDRFVTEGRVKESDISSCIKVAQFLGEYARYQVAYGDATLAQVSPDPTTALPSHAVLEKIDLWVNWVRWQVFLCDDIPFDTYEEAVEWLVQEGDLEEAAYRQTHESQRRRDRKIPEADGNDPVVMGQAGASEIVFQVLQAPPPGDAPRAEDTRRPEGPWRVSQTRREIPYKTANEACIPASEKDAYDYLRHRFSEEFFQTFTREYFGARLPPGPEQVWAVPVYPGTLLDTLEVAAHEISERTGFFKLDVVAYLLAGVKPVLPPVVTRFVKPGIAPTPQTCLDDMAYARTWAVVEVRDPMSLTKAQWLDVYRDLRKRFHIKRINGLTAREEQLFNLVQELGGVPADHGKKGTFWEELRQRWNAIPGANKYSAANGLRRQYKRTERKLETLQQAPT